MLLYIIAAVVAFFAAFNIANWCNSRRAKVCADNARIATVFSGIVLCVLSVFGTYTLVSNSRRSAMMY